MTKMALLNGTLNEKSMTRLLELANDPQPRLVLLENLGGYVSYINPFITVGNAASHLTFVCAGELTSCGAWLGLGLRNFFISPKAELMWHAFGGTEPFTVGSDKASVCWAYASRNIDWSLVTKEEIAKIRSAVLLSGSYTFVPVTPKSLRKRSAVVFGADGSIKPPLTK